MPVLTVRNGGHHTDSFMPKAGEDEVPPGTNLTPLRAQIEHYISKWISKWQEGQKQS